MTEPCDSLVDYLLYIAFFRHLVAGPIVRASDFWPRLARRARVSAADWHFALYWILRGYFLKIVIADNLARLSDAVFPRPGSEIGGEAWVGALAISI